MSMPALKVAALAFMGGGFVTSLASVGYHTQAGVISMVAGTAAMACGALMTLYMMATAVPASATMFQSAALLAPYLGLFASLGSWLAILNVFFDQIAQDHVTPFYNTCSYVSMVCVAFQLWMLVASPVLTRLGGTSMLFFEVTNLSVLILLAVNLKYLSTDG